MVGMVEPLLAMVLVADLLLLGLRRIDTCIRVLAVQGIALGLLPLALHGTEAAGVRLIATAMLGIVVKGALVPFLLLRARQQAGIPRENEPFLSTSASMLLGVLTLVVAVAIAPGLPLPPAAGSSLLVPVALTTMAIGVIQLVTRRLSLTLVLGYLVLENGIYTLGLILVAELPLLVELGVLLDLVVAVFAMGIATFAIKQTFDHIDAHRLDELRG